jgi:chromosome segregation ATPase
MSLASLPESTQKDVTHDSLDHGSSQTTLSRDPRRASLAENQPTLLEKSRNSQSVVQLLQEFVTQVASVASISSERDRVTKKLQTENAELNKAKLRYFQYPSLSGHGRKKQTQSDELGDIEGKLQNHVKAQEELIQELANRISSNAARQKQLEEMIIDVGSTTAEASSAVLDAQKAKDDNTRFSCLKSIVELLGKSSCNQTDNLVSLKQEIEGVRSQLSVLTAKEPRWVKLEQQLDKLENSTRDKHEEVSRRLDEFQKTISLHKSLIDSSSRSMPGEAGSSTSLESGSSQALSVLTSDIQSLAEQLQNLRDLQEAKETLISDEFENLKRLAGGYEKALENLNAELTALKNRAEQAFVPHSSAARNASVPTAPSTVSSSSSIPPPLHQMAGVSSNGQPISPLPVLDLQQAFGNLYNDLFSLKQVVEKHAKALSTHQVSLHSLEMRYNNISSEPIVRQMVIAMQEMYPYASTVQTELDRLKKDVVQLINKQSFLLTATSGGAGQNGVVSQTPEPMSQKAQVYNGLAGSESAQFAELPSTVKVVTQKLESLSDTVNSNNSRIQELHNLREQVKQLAQSVDTALAQVKETARAQLDAKEEKVTLIKDMNAERDRLNDELKSVIFRIDDVEKVTLEKLAFAVHRSEKLSSQIDSLNQRVDEIVVETEKGQQSAHVPKASKTLLSSDMTKSLPRSPQAKPYKHPQTNQKRKHDTFLRDED